MGGEHDRVAVAGQLARGSPTSRVLGRVVEAPGRLVEQHHRRAAGAARRPGPGEPLTLGQVARDGCRGRRRGQVAASAAAGRAGRQRRVVVGGPALGGDRVGVQQDPRRPGAPGRRGGRPAAGAGPCGSRPSSVDLARLRALRSPTRRAEQRRLAGAVAAHQRDDLAGARRSSSTRQRRATTVRRPTATRLDPTRRAGAAGGPGARRPGRDGQPGSQPLRGRARVADRQRQRRSHPASRPSSTTGGATGEVAMIAAGAPDSTGAPARAACSDPIGVLHDALEAVLGDHARSCRGRARAASAAASTSSAAAGSSADVGSSSTSTRGMRRQHRADGHPLLLRRRTA